LPHPNLVVWVCGDDTESDEFDQLAAIGAPGISIGSCVEGLEDWSFIESDVADDDLTFIRVFVDEVAMVVPPESEEASLFDRRGMTAAVRDALTRFGGEPSLPLIGFEDLIAVFSRSLRLAFERVAHRRIDVARPRTERDVFYGGGPHLLARSVGDSPETLAVWISTVHSHWPSQRELPNSTAFWSYPWGISEATPSPYEMSMLVDVADGRLRVRLIPARGALVEFDVDVPAR
jgi:hypothetical protein